MTHDQPSANFVDNEDAFNHKLFMNGNYTIIIFT